MKTLYPGLLSFCLLISCNPNTKTESKPDHQMRQENQELNQDISQSLSKVIPWKIPENNTKSPQETLILFGEKVISQTSKYIGPLVSDPNQRFAGNNLSCKNCHLQAGQQINAIGFVGVSSRYPSFRGRENREGNLKERINGCMQRSLNGKPLPLKSKEMNAMIAYMEWLSQGVPKGSQVKGIKTPDLEVLDRAADPKLGKNVFDTKCAVCHQSNGQGLALNPKDLSQGYTFPPLWGTDSYNNGAGMNRVITSAKYIKANMPLGAANLSRAEAFDVAAYINSQERPAKNHLEQDYPNKKLKPVDSSYPPFADDFSALQHKYGPFKPIMAARITTN